MYQILLAAIDELLAIKIFIICSYEQYYARNRIKLILSAINMPEYYMLNFSGLIAVNYASMIKMP